MGKVSISRNAERMDVSCSSTHKITPVRPRPPIVAAKRSAYSSRLRVSTLPDERASPSRSTQEPNTRTPATTTPTSTSTPWGPLWQRSDIRRGHRPQRRRSSRMDARAVLGRQPTTCRIRRKTIRPRWPRRGALSVREAHGLAPIQCQFSLRRVSRCSVSARATGCMR